MVIFDYQRINFIEKYEASIGLYKNKWIVCTEIGEYPSKYLRLALTNAIKDQIKYEKEKGFMKD